MPVQRPIGQSDGLVDRRSSFVELSDGLFETCLIKHVFLRWVSDQAWLYPMGLRSDMLVSIESPIGLRLL